MLMTTTHIGEQFENNLSPQLMTWGLSSTQLPSSATEVYLLLASDGEKQRSKILSIEDAGHEEMKVR
jgi:hypothetical protein